MSAAHIPPNWRIAETVRPGVRIGEMILFTGTFPDEEGIAIANLIAAAPELLEALQLFVAWSKEELNHTPGIGFWDRVEMFRELDLKAAEAIAKATGAQA
jgi:hypothetical protein